MKKTVLTIAAALLLTATACASAPELRNMMPNSWEKLTRLTEPEEKEFLSRQQVKSDIEDIKSGSWGAPKYTIKEKRVYKEKANNVEFYRVLACNQNMADFLNAEYRDGAMAKAEYDSFIKCSMQQTVYAKQGTREIYKICSLEYRVYGITEGNMESSGGSYFLFYDFLIKELNKNEIGFFITEASAGYQTAIEADKIHIEYLKTKRQIHGANSCEFLRVKNEEDFVKALRDNDRRVGIQASAYLFDSRCPLKYSIQNAFDGNPATSYVENTEDDLFDLEIQRLKNYNVTGFIVINGYAKSQELYRANNRPGNYQYNSEGDESLIDNVKLQDNYMNYQKFENCFMNNPFSIVSGTTKIYPGDKYNDTCLAEFNLLCKNGALLFGEINE